jgi:hypothetical protein
VDLEELDFIVENRYFSKGKLSGARSSFLHTSEWFCDRVEVDLPGTVLFIGFFFERTN